MQRIEPIGARLIVKPLKKEDEILDSGIIVLDEQLATGEVIEVGDEYADKYNVGDIVIFPKEAGLNLYHYKKNAACLFLNGKAASDGGDIYGILTEEKE